MVRFARAQHRSDLVGHSSRLVNWPVASDPLVVIDLDGRTPLLTVDTPNPALVIGHSTRSADRDLEGVDVALTTGDGVGRSWSTSMTSTVH